MWWFLTKRKIKELIKEGYIDEYIAARCNVALTVVESIRTKRIC